MKKQNLLLPCSEDTFYEIAKQILACCSEQQAAFYAYNNKYTQEYIASAKQNLETAYGLRNMTARQEVTDRAKCTLLTANCNSKKRCQELFVYIGKSFPKDDAGYMYRLAGSSFFALASNDSWRGTGMMLSMSVAFINMYAPELFTGNMPDNFQDTISSTKEAFEHALYQYTAAKNSFIQGYEKKREANNEALLELQKVMKDGKAIFRNTSAIRQYFSFTSAMKLFSHSGKAGFRFMLEEEGTWQQVSTAAAV